LTFVFVSGQFLVSLSRTANTDLERSGVMAKNERRMARKPPTKFPNLRKKLQKAKIQSKQPNKK
jgi:hypothetical protein